MATTTPENPWGQSIKRPDANRMYKNFYKIKKRALSPLGTTFKEDCEDHRYHAGLVKDKGCSFLDYVYVFDIRNLLPLLVDEHGKPKVNGIVIYNGTRDKEDSKTTPFDAKKPTFNDTDGRPTLIVFPFKYETVDDKIFDDKHAATLHVLLDDDGLEHPGTGGGGGSIVGAGGSNGIEAKALDPQPGDTFLPIPSQLQDHIYATSIHFKNNLL